MLAHFASHAISLWFKALSSSFLLTVMDPKTTRETWWNLTSRLNIRVLQQKVQTTAWQVVSLCVKTAAVVFIFNSSSVLIASSFWSFRWMWWKYKHERVKGTLSSVVIFQFQHSQIHTHCCCVSIHGLHPSEATYEDQLHHKAAQRLFRFEGSS